MKKILTSLLFILPLFAIAQNTLEGKTYRTKTSESCSKTTTGGYMTYSHMTIAFAKDSVTFISYSKDSDKDQPEITQTNYKYTLKDSGIYIDNPNNSHYVFNNSVLVSDCKYDSGKEYYEIVSD